MDLSNWGLGLQGSGLDLPTDQVVECSNIEIGGRQYPQQLHCRVVWEPRTLTFWDNCCTQHHAVWDYYPYSRKAERVSIVGEKRPGR